MIRSGLGRIVLCNSWFGSIKTSVELHKITRLYSNMHVKSSHKNYQWFMLRTRPMDIGIGRDQWFEDHGNTFSGLAEKTVHLLMHNWLEQTSISDETSRTSSPTASCVWLQVASASINIHNQFCTGSTAIQWWKCGRPKNAHLQHFAEVFGFCFMNGYLIYHHFWKSLIKHSALEIKLANALLESKEDSHHLQGLSLGSPAEEVKDMVYVLVLLKKPTKGKDGKERKFQRYQKYCFYCQHNLDKALSKQKTSWHCEACVETKPILTNV